MSAQKPFTKGKQMGLTLMLRVRNAAHRRDLSDEQRRFVLREVCGRSGCIHRRELLDAVLRTGCQWHYVSKRHLIWAGVFLLSALESQRHMDARDTLNMLLAARFVSTRIVENHLTSSSSEHFAIEHRGVDRLRDVGHLYHVPSFKTPAMAASKSLAFFSS